MNIPFLDLKAQYISIKKEIDEAIQDVINNTSFVLGKSVHEFEKNFGTEHNCEYCFGVSSGTDGNHLALWSLGIGPGDEVIIPANTFIATAWGATLCGATPVFVDCEADSYNISPEAVEKAITKKTKAIVAVHLYGQPADMDPLLEIAKKHKIHLVEDCAQAHFAEYNGKRVGSFGVTSSFSFYPGKNLGAFGEAGAVLTNKKDIAEIMEMKRNHGSVMKYYHKTFGHNYRMEGIQGAVLGVKLKYLNEWTNKRRIAAEKYKELLKDVKEITLPKEMSYAKHVYHLFVIRTANEKQRDELAEYLNSKGVSTGLHYPVPLHIQDCFSDLGYKKGDFPVSEELAVTALSLPMFAEISEEQQEYVCSSIKEFFAVTEQKEVKYTGSEMPSVAE